jgi:plastocyanin
MKSRFLRSIVFACVTVCVLAHTPAAAAAVGTIKGRVRLGGAPPGNPVIRMRVDPMCAKINRGKLVVEELVMASKDGGLANVFVKLQGAFPRTPVPTNTVTIDQRDCVYAPRMIGARVGQTLLVRNSDPLLHNVHSLSSGSNSFNVGQPQAGLENRFQLKAAEILRLKCDVHRWMRAYIGVVDHPYFAVTGNDGAFEIANVPVGTQILHIWHERYGDLEQAVRVNPGATTTVTLTYTGAEKAP